MINWKQNAFDTVNRLKANATPERLDAILSDDKRRDELITDLLTFWKAAIKAVEVDQHFAEVGPAIEKACAWVNYLGIKKKGSDLLRN